MCGIALIISDSNALVRSSVDKLKEGLSHRGPDGSNNVIFNNKNLSIGFAHTRLSIIDLSSAGDQPMTDLTNGNVIIFNGEIYNFQELREILVRSGEVFQSNSDTEVLLKGYKLWGITVLLNKIRGMYSFCIYDKSKEEITLVRDPLGIKPLYYGFDGKNFVCASEIKPIVSLDVFGNKISKHSIDSYLAYGSVQPPNTIYENIKMILPGHMLKLKLDSIISISSSENYWEWNDKTSNNNITIDDLTSSLYASIERHLVSDVPVGVLLSGGYDSSAISLLASIKSKNPICSYTLSFSDNAFMSENLNAKKIADFCNIENHSLIVSNQDMIDSFNSFFMTMDQPSDDGFNIFIISRMLKEFGNKVFLHGVGGDELFGGYPSFKDVPKAFKFKKFNSWILRKALNLLDDKKISIKKIKELLKQDFDFLFAMYVRRNIFGFKERNSLLDNYDCLSDMAIDRKLKDFLSLNTNSYKSFSSKISIHELLQYSSSKLLVDGDSMSMSQGLEFRFPLLDIDLVSNVLSFKDKLDASSKMNNDKEILKKSIKNFPNHLMMNKKMGFTLPITDFIKDEIRNNFDEINSILIEDFNFSVSGLNDFWIWYHQSNEPNSWLRGWLLMSLAQWSKHHSFSLN